MRIRNNSYLPAINVSSDPKAFIQYTYPFNRPKPPKLPLQIRLFRIITQPRDKERLERISTDLRIIRRIIYNTLRQPQIPNSKYHTTTTVKDIHSANPAVTNFSCLSFFSIFSRSFRCSQLSVG